MSWLTRLFHRAPDPTKHWSVEETWLKTDADLFVRTAHYGDHIVLQEMWSRGVDANSESWWGGHALVDAARRGDQALVALLLGLGADPNVGDTAGEYHTPLTAAVSEGREEVVRQLIAAGADVNKQRVYYLETPLEIARKNSSATIEQVLKSAGARN
jgi:hypothetical protein